MELRKGIGWLHGFLRIVIFAGRVNGLLEVRSVSDFKGFSPHCDFCITQTHIMIRRAALGNISPEPGSYHCSHFSSFQGRRQPQLHQRSGGFQQDLARALQDLTDTQKLPPGRFCHLRQLPHRQAMFYLHRRRQYIPVVGNCKDGETVVLRSCL
ncbi:Hypothetical predicted protein [Podarcis lilfordi]|uniref:Uncharacterized protein n=1 Tax=Podarcis lilfordi TaxID=74358 RepID=A0AA35PTH3_9SAUR|nr:Hypothetical predicted protein [Podarcis lilfordi]